ncbi:hypothetical protein THASP1DRAFT_32735 [Thamnocephalis sphaerospora]|uniref:Arp2/3 complex 34 kDa subunit n=1 Tax=Thamnocephalis sphaerospora TaxID=78915 RepID=A0A4P9XIB9_9FUNG|nr:hypothetical protein THASP1DRAFT_32735 [Thamnocephalis sphaerospora]|eukprot:RKP05428.1 hypothetical protein THASP1DRAFT_32735 [Thamnocephalis sphaerospora]
MILLETQNVVLRDTLTKHFASQRAEPLDITFVDFDGVTFHLHTPDADDFYKLLLSVRWDCYSQLVEYGARDLLQREYGPYLNETAEDGWHASFSIDPRTIEGDKGR